MSATYMGRYDWKMSTRRWVTESLATTGSLTPAMTPVASGSNGFVPLVKSAFAFSITTSLLFLVGLAFNSAFQDAFQKVFGDENNLVIFKFLYAVFLLLVATLAIFVVSKTEKIPVDQMGLPFII